MVCIARRSPCAFRLPSSHRSTPPVHGRGRAAARDYNFTPRTALRLVVQNVRTLRDPALYVAPTIAVEGSLTLSALFTYRWSWASAAYLGLGDDREVGSAGTFAPGHQQLLVKVEVATP